MSDSLIKAAKDLLRAVDEQHATAQPPLKYTVPWDALTSLRAATSPHHQQQESSMSHTPGPWNVAILERPQLRPYYIVRQVSENHWEQLRDDDGGIARFESHEEASAAIAKAAEVERSRQ